MKNPIEVLSDIELSEAVDDYIDYVHCLHGVDEDNEQSIINILKEVVRRLNGQNSTN